VSGDVRGDVVAGLGGVHGAVERVEWLEHVERSPVAVEQLANERRTTPLVRHQHHRPNADTTNAQILYTRYDTIRDARLTCNSKAGMSHINLPHGADNKKMKKQKN